MKRRNRLLIWILEGVSSSLGGGVAGIRGIVTSGEDQRPAEILIDKCEILYVGHQPIPIRVRLPEQTIRLTFINRNSQKRIRRIQQNHKLLRRDLPVPPMRHPIVVVHPLQCDFAAMPLQKKARLDNI